MDNEAREVEEDSNEGCGRREEEGGRVSKGLNKCRGEVAGEGREEGGEGRWLAGKAAGERVGRASERETRCVVVDMDGAPCKGNAVVKVEGMDDVGAPVVHVRRPFVDLVKGHPLFHFLHDLVLSQNCRDLRPKPKLYVRLNILYVHVHL